MSQRRDMWRRRRFLRGTGAALALPWFASLAPRKALADTPSLPPKRILYYYTPNGFRMDAFIPKDVGSGYTPSPLLAPLAAHLPELLIISGLDNKPGNYNPELDACCGAHFQQTASFLTATHVQKEPYSVGISIDQVIANYLGYITPRKSIQFAMTPGGQAGSTCAGNNWPCNYKDYVSWAGPTSPMVTEINPLTAFNSLFSQGTAGQSEVDFQIRKARQLKVLDIVREDALALKNVLGKADQYRLDQYLTSVNETENKVTSSTFGLACDPGSAPAIAQSYTERLEYMLDVWVLALQCDLTRVSSFMTAPGGASFTQGYDWVNYNGAPITESFHTVSHHGNTEEKLGKIEAINAWELQVFSGLLDRMKAIPESDGTTLLDNSVVFFSSEVSDGDTHSADNLPIILAGSGQGTITTGRHLSYSAPNNVYADLHIALAQYMGVPIETFGDDGTSALSGLEA